MRLESITRFLPGLIATLVLGVIATLAVVSVGYPENRLNLHDSGIWVTNDAEQSYGRINKSAVGLDAFLDLPGAAGAAELDVLQDGAAAIEYDAAGGSLVPIDSSAVTNAADQAINLKPGSLIDLRGGTLAALDPATGKLWAGRYDPEQRIADIRALDPALPALAELGEAPAGLTGQTAALAVGDDGTVHAVSVTGATLTIKASGEGFEPAVTGKLATGVRSVQVAAVGARSVVYDDTLGLVILPDGRTKQVTAAAGGRLQASGPDAPGVLLALPEGLLRIGLDDGLSTQLAAGIGSAPAAPVRLAGCDFGAWAGTPTTVVRACAEGTAESMAVTSRAQPLVRPVFRINRGALVLNDAADGRVYDLDQQLRLDNWDKIKPKSNQNPNDPENSDKPALKDAQPRANDDRVGARAGRTQLVHPLDNDTDSISSILMISSVSGAPDGYGVEVTPDGQAVKVTTPSDAKSFSFRYTAGNGYPEDQATVSVDLKGADVNGKPYLRDGAGKPSYSVPSFGTLNIAPLGDWRDPESDPVLLVDASSDGEIVPTTPDGRLEYTAAGQDADVRKKIGYRVTDVPGNEVGQSVTVTVLGDKALTGGKPVANPDTARGQVGKPIVIRPLANDLPGSDPRTPDAKLELGGDIAAKANLKVSTDQRSGLVTVTASRPGPYFLDYVAAYGSARVNRSQIRIDVAKDAAGFVPQTMPDSAAIRGVNPVRVDVLANDADPQGGLLTVQSTRTDADVDVSVIGGRWLMVTPRSARITPNPFTVHYTVSNGFQSAEGDVTIAQLDAVGNDAPLTRKDRAVVRDGDTVLINALSNDTSPAGSRLSLVTNLDTGTVGKLALYDAGGGSEASADVGEAWVSDDQVRYVAPTGLTDARQVTIEYYAQTPTGERTKGEISVTIKPQPENADDNHAPRPGDIEARAAAGQRITISLPTASSDPDGDSVTVAGIGSAPNLGRVVGSSPTSVTYEAYPDAENVGTDTFSILVTDRYGKQAPAIVRVGVTPPGAPQPAVAIPDDVTAAPGAIIRVDARANDLIARGDSVGIAPLEPLNDQLPAGVKVTKDGFITAQAPENGQPLLLQYALRGNGGTGPSAGITINPQDGYENPPVVFDEVAVIDGAVARVDVLKRAWDPDGRDESLTARVLRADPAITLTGGTVTVPVTDAPQVIPFVVTDQRGAESAALIFVPPAGGGAPALRPGALIKVDQDSSTNVTVGDVVMSPRELPVRLTTADTLAASPADKVSIEAVDDNTFTVTATDGYVGPAAVTVQVMDGESATDEGVLTSYVTIPVQVGPSTPVLRCPDDPITLPAGGESRTLDITTLCNVWTTDAGGAATLSYTANWAGAAPGGIDVKAGRTVELTASGAAKPGTRGELVIGVAGTRAATQTLNIRVGKAPLPSLQGRTYTDIKQGTPVRVPIGISSPLADAKPGVVKVTQLSGPDTAYTVSGTTVTFTPSGDAHGEIVFEVTGTDVADHSRTDRQVTARFTLVVYGVPGKPSAPRPGPKVQSKAETLSWTAPAANGSPITGYEVRDNNGRITRCAATSCRITGLTNGQWYTFGVRALNKAGSGDWSDASKRIRPDQPPPAPSGLKVSNPQDHAVTLSWKPVKFEGSAVKAYHILVDGRRISVSGSATSQVIRGLDNNTIYSISLAAENELAIGPASRVQGQSAGKPLGLNAPSFAPATATGAATAVRVSWNLPDKNGPSDLTFSLVRDGSKKICSNVSATACTDDRVVYDGATHSYVVTARNGAGKTSTSKASWTAIGVPAQPAAPRVSPTGNDRTIRVTGTAPDSRGKQSTLRILANGSAVASFQVSARGQAFDRNVSVPADGVAYTFTLQVCNEERCGSASAGAGATAYGQLQNLTLTKLPADGHNVSFRVSVNPNGKAAAVSVDGQGKGSTDKRDGTWSATYSYDLGGYQRNRTFTVRVSDGTRTVSKNITLTSANPPDPKVTLIWGPYNASNPEGCNFSSHCRFVGARISNAQGTLNCTVRDSYGSAFRTNWRQGNGEEITQAYWGIHPDSAWIEVDCSGYKDRWYGSRPA